jgi:hypothetical protein
MVVAPWLALQTSAPSTAVTFSRLLLCRAMPTPRFLRRSRTARYHAPARVLSAPLTPPLSFCMSRPPCGTARARQRSGRRAFTQCLSSSNSGTVRWTCACQFLLPSRCIACLLLFAVLSPAFFASVDALQILNPLLRRSVSHTPDVVSAGVRTPLLFRQVKYSGNGTFYTYGGNCSMGQLLPRGLKMSERNGHNLRQAYGSFLPASYLADPSKVFLQSDNSDRVIASGNAVFRAIFKDDMSASYSSDSLPYVDWFVPDNSPMNPGDFCKVELAVSTPAAPSLFICVLCRQSRVDAGALVCRPQLQRVQAPTLRTSNNFVH